jgi:SAM-dependent methyltransferase
LEIGAGHGRGTVFFASKGLSVDALDYHSITAIEISGKMAAKKKLKIKPRVYNVNKPFPFPDTHFDAVYSHMLLNMRFSLEEIHSILSEITRVLKPNGLNFFSARNHNDKFYGKGVEVENGIYDINGFEIRFLSN